jgi:hypothetical protein
MSLAVTFGITNELLLMVRQYGRGADLVTAGNGAKLKNSTQEALEAEIGMLTEEGMAELAHTCQTILEADFKQIVQDSLGLTLTAIEVFKRPVAAEDELDEEFVEYGGESSTDEEEEYILCIHTTEGGTAEVNISKMGAKFSPNFNELIKERSVLCWLLDSRSPFFEPEYASHIMDATALMNFRGQLVSDAALHHELIQVLDSMFRGDLH